MQIIRGVMKASVLAAAVAPWPHAAAGQTYDNQTLIGTTTIPDGSTATVINDLTLDDAQVDVFGTLDFQGINTLGGTGRIDLLPGGSLEINGPQLTVLNGVEIVGNASAVTIIPRITTSLTNQQDTLINYGTIASEGGTATDLLVDLVISSSTAVNHGSIIARQDSELSVSWDTGWNNLGTFRAEDGGVFSLRGTIDPSRLGTLVAENGGLFSLFGTVNNTGQAWTLNQATGSLRLQNSTINGGTIVGNDNVKLYSAVEGGTLYSLNLNGGVVLDIDVDIQGSASNVNVADGLTVNRAFIFNGNNLAFNGAAQTLGGTGELRMFERMDLNGDLTIAPGMTVRGESFAGTYFSNNAAQLHNQGTMIDSNRDWSLSNNVALLNSGTIRSESRAVYLPDQAVNTGQLISDSGFLYLENTYQDGQVTTLNNGSLWIEGLTNTANGSIIADGGRVTLEGAIINNGAIAINNAQLLWDAPVITGNAVSVNDSTFVILSDHVSDQLPSAGFVRNNTGWGLGRNATLDNHGRTITLTSDRLTQWTMYDGSTIEGGVIDSPDNTPLRVEGSSGTTFFATLDGVELRAPVAIKSRLRIENGTQVLGQVILEGGQIAFQDPMDITNLPDFAGPGGRVVVPTPSIDFAGQPWHIPDAVDAFAPTNVGGTPTVISNTTLVGQTGQTLEISGSFSTSFPEIVFRDLTVATNTQVNASYTTLGIEGAVTLQDTEITIIGGGSSGSSLFRHGEILIADGASLAGNGTIRFGNTINGTGIGGFFTAGSELLIDTGITVIGGENGLGWLGSSGATTRNLGTLVIKENSSSQAGLRVLGDGFQNEGSIKTTLGGWLGVDGDATLGGELDVEIAEGFALSESDSFTLIDIAGARSGVFTNVAEGGLLGNFGGMSLLLTYLGGDGNDVVAYTLVSGDADGDGDIDDADLGIVISNFTGPVGEAGSKTFGQGDTDGDGDVDDTDLGVMISGFTGPLSPTNVPEPASLTLLAFVGLFAARRRRSA